MLVKRFTSDLFAAVPVDQATPRTQQSKRVNEREMTAIMDTETAQQQQQQQQPHVADESASERFFCEELEEDLTEQIESANNLSDDSNDSTNDVSADAKRDAVVKYIAQNVIGRNTLFDSPFGPRAVCYADFTASNKALACIETYIQREVLPLYGNTHTTTSITGLQTTCFRHEARQILAQAVNAKVTGRGAEDVVLFTGPGSTSAANKLVTALGLHVPLASDEASNRPVVFVGPFEHHSNLLPWRESNAEVVTIPESATAAGTIDLDALRAALRQFAHRPLKIGAFSAASNLTGVLADTDAVSALLHQHGALAVWDYATCAPYVSIDMNPVVADESQRPFVYKDAVFLSGHKFVGGPGSPGVLVVKKRLLGNAVPTAVGGGTVFFVTERDHRYLSNREEREEGGTPDIVGSIRLGLAIELKQRVGAAKIMAIERQHVERVRRALATLPNVVVLGGVDDNVDGAQQLPIFSFLVRFGSRFLHYNFVSALLNDLFGIQTRGGCQCAGPYATRLLGIARADVLALETALLEKKELLRPGFSRVSFPYFMDDAQVDYVLQAIAFVATDGYKFLSLYKFNHKSGAWAHASRFTKFPSRKWLSHFAIDAAVCTSSNSRPTELDGSDAALRAHERANLAHAKQLAAECVRSAGSSSSTTTAAQMLDDSYEALRWFVYPHEAADAIRSGEAPRATAEICGPYQPQRYMSGTLRNQWTDDATSAGSSGSSAGTATRERTSAFAKYGLAPPAAVAAAVATTAVATTPTQPWSSSSSSSSRETGGKYPLRSAAASNSESELSRPASTAMATATTATTATTTTTPAPTFEHVQRVLQQMTQTVVTTTLFPTPPKKLMRSVGQAIIQWNMIEDGDRLLLGVSGGKDSLSLLHVLLAFQKRAPVRFTLACATVDPQTPSFDPSPLKAYMQALGVEYHYLSENIIERAACELSGDSICSYCSRMKRGLLYTCCRTHGFNKLVLAQHLDDLAESFLMSAMHNGQLRTMKATYWNDQRDVEIVRPLAYTREHVLKAFAYDARLPVINENCPACFEEPKERHRVKKMLAQEESLNPEMYNSLRRALLPLMDDSVYTPLDAIRTRIEQSKHARPKVASAKQSKPKAKSDDDSTVGRDDSAGVSVAVERAVAASNA